MRILQEMCSIPTAPFVEDRVYEYVDAFVKSRPRLRMRRDEFGNRLIVLPGKRPSRRLIFVAHTDHPGFVVRKMRDTRTVECDFRGGVLAEYVQGSRVRFFDGDAEAIGVVTEVIPHKERKVFAGGAVVRLSATRSLPKNTPGMFDQGEGRIKGGKFLSRVCDDLAGAAAALTMLDELHAKGSPRSTVGVLLTRAEEDGFIGAIGAVMKPTLLKRDDLVISIECSAAQPYAPQGNGVIVRVGDRISIFNSALTFFLAQQCEQLAKRDKRFKRQRSLMPGGACEGTVFDAYGYTAAAACVPLGNYHNMDRDKKKIGPEFVDVEDWKSMVKLFVALANNAHTFDPTMGPLKKRLEKRFKSLRRLLQVH